MAASNSNYDSQPSCSPTSQGTPRGYPGVGWYGAGWYGVAFLFILITCSFLFLYLVPTAHAASRGRITGQLLDGTRKNVPVAGQSVTLQMAQGNTSQDLTTVKTDAHGAYTFSNLA